MISCSQKFRRALLIKLQTPVVKARVWTQSIRPIASKYSMFLHYAAWHLLDLVKFERLFLFLSKPHPFSVFLWLLSYLFGHTFKFQIVRFFRVDRRLPNKTNNNRPLTGEPDHHKFDKYLLHWEKANNNYYYSFH